MPHLSPMNWLLFLFLTWLLMLLMSFTKYYSNYPHFPMMTKPNTLFKFNSWMWF